MNAPMARPRPFQGFQGPNYTQVPDQLFDELMADLSGAELKVLLYVMRRTFGFKKGSDRISKSQLENGIQRRDGNALDRGTGLSRRAIRMAIDSLVARRVLLKKTWQSDEKGHESTEYALNVIGQDPWVKSTPGGGVKSTPGLGYKVPTQETVGQQTENVERSRSNAAHNDPGDQGHDEHATLLDQAGKPLSLAARAAYDAYRQAAAAGKMPSLDKLGTPRKASAAAQGLSDQEVGLALGLADEMAEVLGARQRNAGYYRTLAFHAIKHRYLPLVRQCLAETKAGDVPRGTVANRPGYFTRVLQSKAKAQGVTLPIKPPARTR